MIVFNFYNLILIFLFSEVLVWRVVRNGSHLFCTTPGPRQNQDAGKHILCTAKLLCLVFFFYGTSVIPFLQLTHSSRKGRLNTEQNMNLSNRFLLRLFLSRAGLYRKALKITLNSLVIPLFFKSSIGFHFYIIPD